ncbi:MAG: gamma-glutamyl-gamma-aminobutyrate hydrolase family protein, partial [Armatimonadota bacterium]|nr:gamma-glutamyl-gamma-aminobutyrate hydrolase family protein [Armatimonadota bacterium]
MVRSPVIALTIGVPLSEWSAHDDRGRYIPYAQAVIQAGGIPVMVGTEQAPAILGDPAAFLRRFDGLLLTGGGDVHPALYPNPPSFPGESWEEVIARHQMRVEENRDEMELALAQAAYDGGFPTLGVCRGHQVLNVALGGRLIL